MIQYRDGYKYQLYRTADFKLPGIFETFVCKSYFINLVAGELTISAGYAWDGPSGPTWDSKSGMQGALIHDALYQLMRENKLPRSLKADADVLFYQTCLEDGMWKPRAWFWYRAVKRFGTGATIRNKDIKIAP